MNVVFRTIRGSVCASAFFLLVGGLPAHAQQAAATGAAPTAAAMDVKGHAYERSLLLANAKLPLNGAGTRYKLVVPVYTAGLWTPRRVNTLADMLATPGPKRLKLTMLRTVSANELGRMFRTGVTANLAPADANQAMIGLSKMGTIFSNAKNVNAGDTIVMDWVPGKGTVIYIRDQFQGSIAEPEFYKALMGLWLGQNPVDWKLKEGLLGGA